MQRIFVFIFLIFSVACATTSYRAAPGAYKLSDFIYIEDFCRRHNLQYNYDTIDDTIMIRSANIDMRLILNSNIGYLNGRIFALPKEPIYSYGRILVPKDIERVLSSGETTVFKLPLNIKTVVVDPGHGGKDPGAISATGLEEKDLNLKVSKYLKDELEQRGFKVILTRSGDKYLTLQERVDVARQNNADLFISIHSNSSRSRSLKGVEMYHLSAARFNSEERAIDLAKEECSKMKEMPFDAEVILWDMLLSKNYTLSIEFSHALYFNFKNLGFNVKPPKKAPFYVLRLAYVPSVLVEIGYISNRYEERFLKRDSYQSQIAEAIALGVSTLNKKYENFADKNAK
jgi:N-acetylmuramoyl-L-alanine amidase